MRGNSDAQGQANARAICEETTHPQRTLGHESDANCLDLCMHICTAPTVSCMLCSILLEIWTFVIFNLNHCLTDFKVALNMLSEVLSKFINNALGLHLDLKHQGVRDLCGKI